MSADEGYTLTWIGESAPLLDGSWARPDTLGAMPPERLTALELPVGRRRVPLGHLFEVRGEPGPTLRVRQAPPMDELGARMTAGQLLIEGVAGDRLGASMRAGHIRVSGSAGHRVGGPAVGEDRGMRGGSILVGGSAGQEVGLRMRRGLVCIEGPCGLCPGYRMMAGTLALMSGPYEHPGLEMRRGTILCLDTEAGVPQGTGSAFEPDGVFDADQLPAIRLVLLELRRLGVAWPEAVLGASVRLLRGDRFELNRGEIWQWLSQSA